MRVKTIRFFFLLALGCPLALLSACGDWHTQPVYPTKVTGSDKILYTGQDPNSVYGTPAAHPVEDKAAAKAAPAENPHLWKAALDTVAAMPIASMDAPHGVLLTDWYENPASPGQRLKFEIHIHDRKTGPDSVDVVASRQVRKAGDWRDATAPDDLAAALKNDILTRAGGPRSAQ